MRLDKKKKKIEVMRIVDERKRLDLRKVEEGEGLIWVNLWKKEIIMIFEKIRNNVSIVWGIENVEIGIRKGDNEEIEELDVKRDKEMGGEERKIVEEGLDIGIDRKGEKVMENNEREGEIEYKEDVVRGEYGIEEKVEEKGWEGVEEGFYKNKRGWKEREKKKNGDRKV